MTKKNSTVKEILNRNGFIVYGIQGVSMLPLLEEERDSVCLEAIDNYESGLNIGDVVLFERKNGALVLHRIVGVNGDEYQILGDNCVGAETAAKEQILAIMTGYYKEKEYHSVDELHYKEYTEKMLALDPKDRVIIPRNLEKEIKISFRKFGKWGFIFKKIFPKLETMQDAFPVLNKAPILLPFCWIVRIVRSIFNKGSRRYLVLLIKTKG